jgi:2-polyprenyl-6-methoxyphenol hydroxylase-like FAD-dependent oxidoreductase
MASIVVCGGSVIGLATAMMLARDGHRVTVLERDAAAPPPPGAAVRAWDGWARPGVAQFHQPHNLFSRARLVLDEELPGLVDGLVEAGCVWVDPIAMAPPSLDKTPQEGDDRFRFVTGRRPVMEAVLAQAAAEEEGVDVRRGVSGARLLTGTGSGGAGAAGVPHVVGVRTTDGDELAADLVIDATGRRTRLAEWLVAVGARPPHVESEDSGFVYHTRYFTGLRLPRTLSSPVSEIGTISLLTIPGDNGTWSVTVWAASADTALRGLRDADRFTAVVKACPLQRGWVRGEPITDVLTMAGVLDRYRRFVVDGAPVATGVVAVGDAWACTNPSAGRGITVGLMHAQGLRHVVRAAGLDDPEGLVRAFDQVTEERVAPYYWNQITADRRRMAEMDALRRGDEPAAPDPTTVAVGGAMFQDPDVFRGVVETAMCLALPEEVFARPGFMDKVAALPPAPPRPTPGPDRKELLALLA